MLTQGTGGRAFTRSETLRRGDVMSTYEEFMIIIAVANLIAAILNLTHKNSRPDPAKVDGYFLV